MKRTLLVVSIFAVAAGLFLPDLAKPAFAGKEHARINDEALVNRTTLDEARSAAIDKLLVARASGVPFAIQEIEILDAYEAGVSIASIEADLLATRTIYAAYLARRPLTAEQKDLVGRYVPYRKAHVRDLIARNAALNAEHPEAKGTAQPDESRDFELYSDPELFNQLSSAYQNRLERIYGHKSRVRGAARSNEQSATPDTIEAVPPNTLVNNPAADTTAQDTQSETSLVFGATNTILSSFNDSGSDVGSAPHFTGTSRSTNLGGSFTDLGILPNDANGDA